MTHHPTHHPAKCLPDALSSANLSSRLTPREPQTRLAFVSNGDVGVRPFVDLDREWARFWIGSGSLLVRFRFTSGSDLAHEMDEKEGKGIAGKAGGRVPWGLLFILASSS
jgi:hypothetical protein